jgi:hypothetical protein
VQEPALLLLRGIVHQLGVGSYEINCPSRGYFFNTLLVVGASTADLGPWLAAANHFTLGVNTIGGKINPILACG